MQPGLRMSRCCSCTCSRGRENPKDCTTLSLVSRRRSESLPRLEFLEGVFLQAMRRGCRLALGLKHAELAAAQRCESRRQVSFQFHPANFEPVEVSLFGGLKMYRSGP